MEHVRESRAPEMKLDASACEMNSSFVSKCRRTITRLGLSSGTARRGTFHLFLRADSAKFTNTATMMHVARARARTPAHAWRVKVTAHCRLRFAWTWDVDVVVRCFSFGDVERALFYGRDDYRSEREGKGEERKRAPLGEGNKISSGKSTESEKRSGPFLRIAAMRFCDRFS